MNNIEIIIGGIVALAGSVTAIIKNSRDIAMLKKYACLRMPCDDRIPADALQSKNSRL